jgi:peptidoglycan hydrolase-like protein with peptidoglycan-binding domain
LQERGYDPGPLDGVVGKKTREALRRFQKDHHYLAVTGEINPDTKSTLLSHEPARAEPVDKRGAY